MVDILEKEAAIFPLKNPALVSIPLSFLTAVVVSLLGKEQSAEDKFESEKLRSYLGVGAE